MSLSCLEELTCSNFLVQGKALEQNIFRTLLFEHPVGDESADGMQAIITFYTVFLLDIKTI